VQRNDDNIAKQATEEEGDQGIPGEEMWSLKYGQQHSSTAGGR